jgi:hypothetical protein
MLAHLCYYSRKNIAQSTSREETNMNYYVKGTISVEFDYIPPTLKEGEEFSREDRDDDIRYNVKVLVCNCINSIPIDDFISKVKEEL